MAVELRCPDCRAKLRLPEAPDAGTEVECPKCGTVFAAPEPEDTGEEEVLKKKKKLARDDEADDDRGEKREKKKTKTKVKADPNAPRKRKAKKRETSKTLLFAVVGLGLLLLGGVGGMLVWFVARTPKSVEMMYYLPEDCETVQGLNLGHAQKYPEFYKGISGTFKDAEFKAAGDAFARVLGSSDGDALIEYVVFGSSNKSGSATVIRTKTEIDGTQLAKLPGSQQKTLGSSTYYLVDGFKGAGKVRVFSPTNRLIAYCSTDVPEGVFQKMLGGHADSKEKTVGVRAGELGKRVTKGTFWGMTLFQGENKPPAASGNAQGGNNDDANAQFGRTQAEALGSAKGAGGKASIGSREVRFEIIIWCADGDKSSSMAKKWKESDLGKGDEGTPPRWWKEQVDSMGKKIGAQMLSNLGFGSSGELFYAKSAVETNDLKDAIGSMAGKVTGRSGGGMGGPPGGMGGPPGGPGGPPVGPPGGPGRPPKGRRKWACR